MRNKIGVMFLSSAIALAMVGGSYAMWSETIVMSGTVQTGTVDIAWSLEGYGDSEIAGKDVSSIGATIDQNGNLVVTITGAYPCIDYWVDFNVECIGSIPVHFGITSTPAYLFDSGIITIISDNGQPLVGTQLHHDEQWFGRLNFHITNDLWTNVLVPQGWAQGGGPYTFTVSITGYQYNEYP
jgi:hypothetical protein